jgi:hypothetical protein
MATLNIKSFPEDLYQLLGEQAKKDRRSLSGEVIYLLEWALVEFSKKKTSVLHLKGLGKQRWKNVDAVKHVEAERDSWE